MAELTLALTFALTLLISLLTLIKGSAIRQETDDIDKDLNVQVLSIGEQRMMGVFDFDAKSIGIYDHGSDICYFIESMSHFPTAKGIFEYKEGEVPLVHFTVDGSALVEDLPSALRSQCTDLTVLKLRHRTRRYRRSSRRLRRMPAFNQYECLKYFLPEVCFRTGF